MLQDNFGIGDEEFWETEGLGLVFFWGFMERGEWEGGGGEGEGGEEEERLLRFEEKFGGIQQRDKRSAR